MWIQFRTWLGTGVKICRYKTLRWCRHNITSPEFYILPHYGSYFSDSIVNGSFSIDLRMLKIQCHLLVKVELELSAFHFNSNFIEGNNVIYKLIDIEFKS